MRTVSNHHKKKYQVSGRFDLEKEKEKQIYVKIGSVKQKKNPWPKSFKRMFRPLLAKNKNKNKNKKQVLGMQCEPPAAGLCGRKKKFYGK